MQKLWKIYFYANVLLPILALIIALQSSSVGVNDVEFNTSVIYYKSEIAYDVFLLILHLVSILGLYGFVYGKKIFYKDFWIFIFVLNIIELLFKFILESDNIKYQDGTVFVMVIFIPLYFALYKYAFKMNELWIENGK